MPIVCECAVTATAYHHVHGSGIPFHGVDRIAGPGGDMGDDGVACLAELAQNICQIFLRLLRPGFCVYDEQYFPQGDTPAPKSFYPNYTTPQKF